MAIQILVPGLGIVNDNESTQFLLPGAGIYNATGTEAGTVLSVAALDQAQGLDGAVVEATFPVEAAVVCPMAYVTEAALICPMGSLIESALVAPYSLRGAPSQRITVAWSVTVGGMAIDCTGIDLSQDEGGYWTCRLDLQSTEDYARFAPDTPFSVQIGATTQYPIVSVGAVEWLTDALNAISHEPYGTTLHAAVEDYSLARITYTTRAYEHSVRASEVTDAQFLAQEVVNG